jgi:hypothetical protein
MAIKLGKTSVCTDCGEVYKTSKGHNCPKKKR